MRKIKAFRKTLMRWLQDQLPPAASVDNQQSQMVQPVEPWVLVDPQSEEDSQYGEVISDGLKKQGKLDVHPDNSPM